MKLILLAAAATLAFPALAQETTAPAGGTPQAGAARAAPPTAADPAQTGDQATSPTPNSPAPTGTNAPTNAPDPATQNRNMGTQTTGGATPMGGYQPSQPAMNGAASPGVTPTFSPAPSPSEAYPAPAPLAKYPVCKKGQYDKCIQRGGR